MMELCFRVEEFAEVLEFGDAHPRRAHLAECPRCRARFATYVEFRAAPAPGTAPQLEEALSSLGRTLDREIWGEETPRTELQDRSHPGYWWRPVLALAAALLLVLVIDSLRERPAERGIVLRTDAAANADRGFDMETPKFDAQGALELRWDAVADADFYRVRLLNADLEEITTVDAPQNFLRLGDEVIRRLLPGPGTFALSVTALSEGDEIARSRPRSLRWGN